MATYTERYIHAATRTLAPEKRDDLAAELAASIDDAVAARVDIGEPADAAERTVLNDMGDPAKLAADYADRPLQLIGPRYYLDWWRLLKILLWTVLPLVAIVVVVVQVLTGGDIGDIIGAAIATPLSAGVHIFFWTTLAFAVLERSGQRESGPLLPWNLDQLPELRAPGLGLVDMIASLVFLVLAVIAVVWDQVIGFVFVRGEMIPILDPALWPWTLVVLVPIAIAEGALAVAVYRRGRWTPTLASLNTVLAVLVCVPLVWAIATGMLVNPRFVDAITGGAEIAPIASIVIALAVLAVGIWDAADGWYKVHRDRRA